MSARARDRLGSFLMLAFVLSLWVQRAYTTPFGGIFPDFVMAALTIIVLVSLALSFTRRAAIKDAAPAERGPAPRVNWTDMAIVGGVLIAWAALLRILGFALCGIVGFTAISWYLAEGRRDPKLIASSVVIAAALTGVLMLVFGRLLQVPLPPGTIFG